MIELRHFQYFVAVAHEQHFGRAAAQLNIAQPALSQQIKRLETLLGTRLFDRTTRQVSLTSEGRALLPKARLTLDHAQRAADAVLHSIHGETGTLRVGFVSSAALSIVPRLTSTLVRQLPSVGIELAEMTTDDQLERLNIGELDIAIVREVVELKGLKIQPLTDEPLWAALHESHHLAERSSIAVGELANDNFVLFPREAVPRLYDHLTGLCWVAGFQMNVTQRALQYATLIGLVAANIGASFVPDPLRLLQVPAVRYVRINSPDASSRVSLAIRSDPPPTQLVQRALSAFMDEFKQS